jgi:RNA polymerase sigma factor (sigma-70 family)
MHRTQFAKALERVGPLLAAQSVERAADGQLLDRFVRRRDEAAFAALVYRHGPMVLAVCRRMLRDHHAAEDALQASFLVLARKASGILRRDQLANWLFGVAYRTALKARALGAKRASREQPFIEQVDSRPNEEPEWREIGRVLDEEIHRLPRQHRAAFVLCYLEGRKQEEAAKLMHCPRGTIATWLTRARDRLRKKLTQRGLAVPAGMLATISAAHTLAAPLRAGLAAVSIRTALAYADTGAASVSPQVAQLTHGVLRTMFLTRMKFIAAGTLLMAMTAGVGLGAIAPRSFPSEAPPPVVRRAPIGDARADALRSEKVALAKNAYTEAWEDHKQQGGSIEAVYDWSKNWLTAQLEVSEDKKARDRAMKEHLERMKELEAAALKQLQEFEEAAKLKQFPISKRGSIAAKFYRAEAELWVEEGKVK